MDSCSDMVRYIGYMAWRVTCVKRRLVWLCRLAFLTFTSMAPIRVQPDSKDTAGFLAKRVKELQSRIDQLMTQSTVVRETKRHIQSPSTVDQSWRFWPGATYLEALPNCQTLKCIREAHRLLPKRNISYNFPHFFIAGYSKSASTSIYQYAR